MGGRFGLPGLTVASLGAGYETVRESIDATAYPCPASSSTWAATGSPALHRLRSPTVVLEPGLREVSSAMAWIAPAVAADSRVCVYGRASRGWSDAADTPRGTARRQPLTSSAMILWSLRLSSDDKRCAHPRNLRRSAACPEGATGPGRSPGRGIELLTVEWIRRPCGCPAAIPSRLERGRGRESACQARTAPSRTVPRGSTRRGSAG